MTGAVAKKRPFWNAYKLIGLILATPLAVLASCEYASRASCLTGAQCSSVLTAPSATDTTARNMLKADQVLNRQGAPVALEIETKDVWFGDDKVLVYAPVEQERLLVDILDTKGLDETEIFRISHDNVYVVAYPHRTGTGSKEVRLAFYDSHDGLKTSTVSLDCENGTFFAPRVDITNPRFDRAKREFSFDFDSDCDTLRHTTGDEIYSGKSDKVRSRVRVLFDDALVPMKVTADRGVRDLEANEQRRLSNDREVNSCLNELARKAADERPNRPGWVGECHAWEETSDSPYAVSRLSGSAAYYDGKEFEADYPQYVLDREYFWCESSGAFAAEPFESGIYLALNCPDVTRGETKPGWIGFKSQVVNVEIFQLQAKVAEFRVGCECSGLVLKKFGKSSEPNTFSFEIGADKEDITVNGTSYRLGSLPSQHKQGEPFGFGRFAIHLSDGGLVERFGAVK